MNKDKSVNKYAFFLPNIFTALNIGCGYLAIIFSMQGEIYKACMVIILGALFDSVDGRVARLTGTESAFGEQFDSLSDLISFGVAPSIIFYNQFLADSGRFGIIVSFMFLLCGALRLARFNANIDKVSSDYFQGLPIPGAAAAVIGYCLLSVEFPSLFLNRFIAIPYILIYALLMISNIPFPSFKKSERVRKNKKKVLFILLILIAALLSYEEVMIVAIMSVYTFGALIYRSTHKEKFSDIFNWEDSDDQVS